MPRERSTSGPSVGNRVIPAEPTIPGLRAAAEACTACSLYKNATQTVFGEGPEGSLLMLVGEQPGDVEDIAGKPFVGPAGRLLDRCLIEAGIDRARIYVTNAVKHFKWVPRGPRRIHSKPGAVEIEACFPWLEAEIAAVRPRIIVALGATSAQACIRHRSSLGLVARAGRGNPSSRSLEIYRRSAKGWVTFDMIGRIPSGSSRTWIAFALASVTVLAVAVVVAGLWSGLGQSEISFAGALAMIFGVVVALALGIGLMSLVFLSSRRGYDEAPRRDH